MRFRRSVAVGISAMAVVAVGVAGGAAQSPSVSPDPAVLACPAMIEARSPLPEPGAAQIQAFGAQNPAYPNPGTGFTGRFHPGEDWAYPDGLGGASVVAISNGRVVAMGSIGADDRGGIVIVEHSGPFTVPASTPGAPWVYPAQTVDSIVSVYQGVDPAPGLKVGACVDTLMLLGVLTAQCGTDVPLPCSVLPAQLHFEIRLPSTLDDAVYSADWSTVGPVTASSDGYYADPQEMVDLGLREPSAFLVSMAVRCPATSPAPSAVAEPATSGAPCSTVPGGPAAAPKGAA